MASTTERRRRSVPRWTTASRWTLKRGPKRPGRERHDRAQSELVIPVFGYKNHLGIDRRRGFIRNFVVIEVADRLLWPPQRGSQTQKHAPPSTKPNPCLS